MKIKVLGPGCPKCKTLEKQVLQVVKENNIEAEVTKVEDIMDIMAYNVMSTPGLVINEKVVFSGRVPSNKELLEIINNNK
ncbi:MAG: redox-active disulfide protein 2 [Bacteroidetes bacterium GWF2_38_335]|nr:MAG: redox-active disulfide protein 2 [Bacteroidetes bacterium GWF2_38_335]OFY80845.1 MAG: redox-active disulfide protein 2 [Bacteroidetes bacterium RIFOXYA12_FULL_38_20]HBS86223.1 thioredoxin family protein [Bacteroidales bacterium]